MPLGETLGFAGRIGDWLPGSIQSVKCSSVSAAGLLGLVGPRYGEMTGADAVVADRLERRTGVSVYDLPACAGGDMRDERRTPTTGLLAEATRRLRTDATGLEAGR